MNDLYGLVGRSISHSLSPDIHNTLFAEHGIDAEYKLFDVNSLNSAVKRLKNKRLKGVNVTKPFKLEILDHLDELDEDVEEIGSSNTVVQLDGTLKGYNTDGVGAKKALERFTDIKNKNILQLGAGGAGRAIAYELAKSSKVMVLNRTLKKAKDLGEFGVKSGRLEKRKLKKELERSDILINATSVGMNEEKSPIDSSYLNEDMLVLDIVYTPLKTKLLKDAERVGCMTVDGLWMLVYQAVKAFQIWTGIEPDPERVRKIVTEERR
ncbi:MAG: shikimate dehydrogenase [Thermoplasmata archaeon]